MQKSVPENTNHWLLLVIVLLFRFALRWNGRRSPEFKNVLGRPRFSNGFCFGHSRPVRTLLNSRPARVSYPTSSSSFVRSRISRFNRFSEIGKATFRATRVRSPDDECPAHTLGVTAHSIKLGKTRFLVQKRRNVVEDFGTHPRGEGWRS